ncbi:MAG: hypothetical protein IJM24_05970 [Clostridia bacterium]|nr:hypothetical protein [Clostridia bacterium]
MTTVPSPRPRSTRCGNIRHQLGIIVNDWIPPEPPQTGDFDTLGIMA